MSEINYPELSLKPLVHLLGKNPEDFQREDLMKVIEEQKITQINLHYTGLDGKLKELKIPVSSLQYANLILAQGERIDGSSIFKELVSSKSSDLYIVPIYKTAFLSPFEDHTLAILCRFIDGDGKPAPFAPDNILMEAHAALKEKTGYTLNALGELEFYLIYDPEDRLYIGSSQRGYHQSSPFVKSGEMVNEMMSIISSLTASVKYAHSEVGYIDSLKSTNPEINGKRAEQYEIEFLPRPIDEMGNHINLAKWVIRNVAARWGCTVTFTPKLEEGMAGNGLHIHVELEKDGKNEMTDQKGNLSEAALKLISGLCKFAPSLTAFGNSVSSAYLRLVSNQEAPTRICWSERNRSSLVRVPLGWNNVDEMETLVNPNQGSCYKTVPGDRQTVELRSPDGSAHINLLLASMAIAIEHGLLSEDSLKAAADFHSNGNDLNDGKFSELPASCSESADALIEQRELYEANDFFPKEIIDYIGRSLQKENDRNINERFSHLTADKRLKATRDIMHKDLHKH